MLQYKADRDNNTEEVTSPLASSDGLSAINENVNISNEISREVDKLLTPTLERTRSGSEIELVAPLRHKRRHYRSQEVLPIEKTLHDPSPRQSQEQIYTGDTPKTPHVSILYDNQRAEIVASVTERLYSKLKKKEEAAVSKVESMVDKKIMEPLSELKICTNARQRLMDLSQKALRNKRRIGIPAYTQTRKTVIRVKDQAIDVQIDLESYAARDKSLSIVYRDASTETNPMTPRCKEIAIGPKYGSLHLDDKSTGTEAKQIVLKSSFMMTEDSVRSDMYTQTRVLPPPRRKRPVAINNAEKTNECIATPIIHINISQKYVESESQSSEDDFEIATNAYRIQNKSNSTTHVCTTPDLLNNHNAIEPASKEDEELFVIQVDENQDIRSGNHLSVKSDVESVTGLTKFVTEDFPESDDLTLPRVSVNCSSKANENEIKNIILGRNDNLYPYNIAISPLREKESTKRIVKFKDTVTNPTEIKSLDTNGLKDDKTLKCIEVNAKKNYDFENNEVVDTSALDNNKNTSDTTSEKDCDDDTSSQAGNSSESVASGKIDSDSFIWERGGGYNNKTCGDKNRYPPVYKSSSKYRTAKSRLYKEFLGLEKEYLDEKKSRACHSLNSDSNRDYSSSESMRADNPQCNFLRSKQFFEDQYKKYNVQNDAYDQLERQLFESCNGREFSAGKYEPYLGNHRRNSAGITQERTPKKYLQHLVQLRKEVIKADSDATESPD